MKSARGVKDRKRKHVGAEGNIIKRARPTREINEDSPVIKMFRNYQNELDMRHDKYERLVKCSRDITIMSKRAIFQLHRLSQNDVETVSEEIDKLQLCLKQLPKTLLEELANEDPYRFIRAFCFGQQEYVEAVTLMHYLRDGLLISYDELCKHYLTFESSDASQTIQVVLLRPIDYMLGVADLTGELMRMCINFMGEGQYERATSICSFMKKIHKEFALFGGGDRELSRKIRVLKQSLSKVENASYTFHLRGTEVPKHMLADLVKFADMSFGSSNEPVDDLEQ